MLAFQGSNLLGKTLNLTLHWHVMPKTGKMFADKIVMRGYSLPREYRWLASYITNSFVLNYYWDPMFKGYILVTVDQMLGKSQSNRVCLQFCWECSHVGLLLLHRQFSCSSFLLEISIIVKEICIWSPPSPKTHTHTHTENPLICRRKHNSECVPYWGANRLIWFHSKLMSNEGGQAI